MPDCSDLCEESHVRLLSLANRISSNRFAEKSGSLGVLCSSQLFKCSERLWPFLFSSHIGVSMHIALGFAYFQCFSAYMGVCLMS